ncbi:TMEM115 [Cordylochernes scorpioides]|uniref:TMEM115 n=1 Tax=Cordylochernes scorpioides TaxID=51811 RepID=A0ABY6JYL5_9ARAC|nr:TMEM115 [Cordylochernes scorpioides]
MPEHVLISTPIGKIRNRNIPLSILVVSILLTLLNVMHGTYTVMFTSGLFTSWIYLRFYQYHSNGTKGDMAECFKFSRVWKEKLILKLDKLGIEGSLPQGSILSPILFNIYLIEVHTFIKSPAKMALYADDIIIWVSKNNLSDAEHSLNTAMKILQKVGYVTVMDSGVVGIKRVASGCNMLIDEGTWVVFWRRYVDDILCICKTDLEETILSTLNSYNPNLSFTMEKEQGHIIPFLDILIIRTPASFHTTVYYKNSSTPTYTHFNSFCPIVHKINIEAAADSVVDSEVEITEAATTAGKKATASLNVPNLPVVVDVAVDRAVMEAATTPARTAEKLATACYTCGEFGHKKDDCPKSGTQESGDEEESSDNEEEETPQKRKQAEDSEEEEVEAEEPPKKKSKKPKSKKKEEDCYLTLQAYRTLPLEKRQEQRNEKTPTSTSTWLSRRCKDDQEQETEEDCPTPMASSTRDGRMQRDNQEQDPEKSLPSMPAVHTRYGWAVKIPRRFL